MVNSQDNILDKVKTDLEFASVAKFTRQTLESNTTEVGFYDFKETSHIASYAKLKNTGWTVIVKAPIKEFMGTINALRNRMMLIGFSILTVSLIILFIVAYKIIRPINVAVGPLKNIAQGEGDLTVRLPLVGNDEITDLSEYFNQTIEKIGSSIKS